MIIELLNRKEEEKRISPQLTIYFLMKIIAKIIQSSTTNPKLVAPNIWLWKDTLSKKAIFPENQKALTIFCKVPQSTIFSILYNFFKLKFQKANSPSI